MGVRASDRLGRNLAERQGVWVSLILKPLIHDLSGGEVVIGIFCHKATAHQFPLFVKALQDTT
jgi:hypothetical protein